MTLGGRTTECKVCGEKKDEISKELGVCVKCIRNNPEMANPHLVSAHTTIREPINLPPTPPRTGEGLSCSLCSNKCVMGEGEKGYCGLRWNIGGMQSLVEKDIGLLHAYFDPHVTNCCGAWFCPGGTGAGYPKYARKPGPERGYLNLSVFFYGCNFNCLYCQNASHKQLDRGTRMTVEELASKININHRITCICYFGGSPEPQLPFSLRVSKRAREYADDRVLRFCWEWNGCGDPGLVSQAADLALESGGNIKFDLKCFTPSLSLALSGVDNKRAFSNFEMIAKQHYPKRPELPVLTATTLLVPGYVDVVEVERIAGFIAELDDSVPYSLLVFHPNYAMSDLPVTPMDQVQECYLAASRLLENVNVGNLHTLGMRNMNEFIRSLPS